MVKLLSNIFMITIIVIVSTKATQTSNTRIVGGGASDLNKVPYVVSISMKYGDYINHFCGGVIIKNNWVLTAAHCKIPVEGTIVRAGSTMNNQGGVTANILKVITHENYNEFNYDNDLALLLLDRTITDKYGGKAINLPWKGTAVYKTGQLVTVSGWGISEFENLHSSEILKTTEVNIIDRTICKKQFENEDITKNMICAASKGKDACQMDSGGPLVLNDHTLIGIVSWGYSCANDNYPGVYVKTSNYIDWIKIVCEL